MSAETNSLLIYDEELNREGLARHPRRHGYEVSGAGGGREALELLGGRRFDLARELDRWRNGSAHNEDLSALLVERTADSTRPGTGGQP
jgi:hypothetical protein